MEEKINLYMINKLLKLFLKKEKESIKNKDFSSLRNLLITHISLVTGFRKSEILALGLDSINDEFQYLIIKDNKWGNQIGKLPNEFFDTLIVYINHIETEKLFDVKEKVILAWYKKFYQKEIKKNIQIRFIYWYFKKIRKFNIIPFKSFHELRLGSVLLNKAYFPSNKSIERIKIAC